MDVLSPWVQDRLALLGDAAHPFLPRKYSIQERERNQKSTAALFRVIYLDIYGNSYKHADQGLGAAYAIGNGASLGVVLQRGVRPKDVPERPHLYEDIRKERAHRLQEYSRLAGLDLRKRKLYCRLMTASVQPSEFDQYCSKKVMEYILTITLATMNGTLNKCFRKWDWARKPNLYWRMPIRFGPMSGPQQTFDGSPRNALNSTFTTALIKFKTSRTVLQNLFPSQSFRFRSHGTVAYARFSPTTLDKMQRLGGSGYEVRYAQKKTESRVELFASPV